MKKILYSFVLVLVLLLSSCKAYQDIWLDPKDDLNAILPNLSVATDTTNIFNVLKINKVFDSDAETLTKNFFNNNIVDYRGLPKGTIDVTIKKNYHKIYNVGYYILSSFTVYTINLLGFPMISQKASVTVNAKIKNKEGRVIKEYTEEGIGKATAAMYWGYTFGGGLTKTAPWGLPRVVHTLALSDALQKIKSNILADSKELNKQIYEKY